MYHNVSIVINPLTGNNKNEFFSTFLLSLTSLRGKIEMNYFNHPIVINPLKGNKNLHYKFKLHCKH